MKNDIDYFGLKTFYNKIPVEQYITISEPKIDELFNNNVNDSSLYKIMSGATVQVNGNQGLVPAPQAGDQVKFLRGDGTWGIPIDTNTTYGIMAGATSQLQGRSGLVPAPTPGDQIKFLRGDGTWGVPIDTNTMYNIMVGATSQLQGGPGLVPKPVVGDQVKFLRGDGTWAIPTDTNTTYDVMTGAAAGTAGKQGLVPTPAAGHQASYLRGDGLWVDPQNNTSTTAAGYVLDARVGTDLSNRIDTINQNLTMYYCDVFYAASPAGDVSFSSSPIVFNTISANVGNCYSTSTGRFIAPKTGTYFTSFAYYSNSSVATTRPVIWKNGAPYLMTNGSYGHCLSGIVHLNQGDNLCVGPYSSSYPVSFYGANGHNRFIVAYIPTK